MLPRRVYDARRLFSKKSASDVTSPMTSPDRKGCNRYVFVFRIVVHVFRTNRVAKTTDGTIELADVKCVYDSPNFGGICANDLWKTCCL